MALIETLVDDFDDAAATAWSYYQFGIIEQGGSLQFSLAQNAAARAKDTWDLLSSAVTVDADLGTGNYGALRWEMLVIEDTYSKAILWRRTASTLQAFLGATSYGPALTYDPLAHRYLRIRANAAKTVYWEHSPDGLAWITHSSTTASSFRLTGALFEMRVDNYDGSTRTAVPTVRALNVPPGPPPQPVTVLASTAVASAVAALPAVRVAGPGIDTLVDDFEDGVIGAQWTVTGMVSETSGAVVIEQSAEASALTSVGSYDLRENQVCVEVEDAPAGLSPGYAETRFQVSGGAGSAAITVAGTPFGRSLYCYSSGALKGDVAYDPLAHRYWRLRQEAGVLHWETGDVYGAWATRYSETVSWSLSSVAVSLSAEAF